MQINFIWKFGRMWKNYWVGDITVTQQIYQIILIKENNILGGVRHYCIFDPLHHQLQLVFQV